MKKAFLLFPVLCLSSLLYGQESEIWGDVNIYKNLNPKLSIFGDTGPRWNTDGKYYGYYIRPSISYKVSDHISLAGGAAWFYANQNDHSVNEFRGWQGTRLEWRVWDRLILSNYIRLEERWFFDPDFLQFRLRFRYMAGVTVPINNRTLEGNTLYLPLAFEVFEDLNDHQTIFVNRTRIYAGLGYVLNKNTRMELFYIANSSRGQRDEAFEVVNVFRLRLHFTIPEKPVLID